MSGSGPVEVQPVATSPGQEKGPDVIAFEDEEKAKRLESVSKLVADLTDEFAVWHVDGMDEWLHQPEDRDLWENVARRRYWEEQTLDEKSLRGADVPVELYWPLDYPKKYHVPFQVAVEHASKWLLVLFEQATGELEELRKVSNCINQLLHLYTEFFPCRFYHHSLRAFQGLLDLLLRPQLGLYLAVHAWLYTGERTPDKGQRVEGAWWRVITQGFDEIKELRKHLHITDPGVAAHLDRSIQTAHGKAYQPAAEDFQILPHLPRADVSRVRSVEQISRIFLELRSAWSEPKFQRVRRALFQHWQGTAKEADTAVLIEAAKTGRLGMFKRHYDLLEKHGFQGNPAGVRDVCQLANHTADPALKHLCRGIACLSQGTVEKLPIPLEGLQVGRRVWAFYDAYMHSQQWKYRFVKVDKPPTNFPLVGLSAGWVQGTIVGKPEANGAVLDGFVRVRVRLDGYFCDSRLVVRHVAVKATGDSTFIDRGTFTGRCCDEGKEFLIPATLLRSSDSPPERPLLSVLNLRPVDYFSFPRASDYNICSDIYVQDMFHGPCSMREQMPGEYEVWSVFVKDTADLDRLDAQELRSRLTGKNTIGWYLLWPQVQSKSVWGSGSVRRQQFFGFCGRAERTGLRMGWPHPSHVYDLLAGKLWIPRMSLCRDFKVMPTAVIDYATFKRHPQSTVIRALDHIAHVRRRVWGEEVLPKDSFKGVVKFGYSWCGTDVLPFMGPEGLSKCCEAMFQKEGNEQTIIMVQEMLPNVFAECRNLCLYDRRRSVYHKERLWVAQMQKTQHQVEGFSGLASSNVLSSEAVCQNCLGGDVEALHAAEAEVDALCDRWLLWLRAESPEPLQCTRIDFLVAKGGGPGQTRVWTCEVGECGGSLCSIEVHGRNTAALNHAVRLDESGRFPSPLHLPLPRNDGSKSH